MNDRQGAPNLPADPRGFTYPLTPYLRQQTWHMERLESRLAQVNRALLAARAEGDALQAAFADQASHLHRLMQPRPDPLAQQRGLTYLAFLQGQIQAQAEEMTRLASQKSTLQTECVAQQRKIDGLAEHRAAAVQDHANELARLAAAEADREWIGRLRYPATRAFHPAGDAP